MNKHSNLFLVLPQLQYLGELSPLGNVHTSGGVVQSGQEVGVVGVPQGALGMGGEKRPKQKRQHIQNNE